MSARLLVHDALDLGSLDGPFETVLDSGLFHVLEDADRFRFVDALRVVTAVGGRYHMLCFSDQQSGDWGPRRVREDEIRECFSSGWRVESIKPAYFETNLDPYRAHAWHSTIGPGQRATLAGSAGATVRPIHDPWDGAMPRYRVTLTRTTVELVGAPNPYQAAIVGNRGSDAEVVDVRPAVGRPTNPTKNVKKAVKKRKPLSPEARARLAQNLVKARAARAAKAKAAKKATGKRTTKKTPASRAPKKTVRNAPAKKAKPAKKR